MLMISIRNKCYAKSCNAIELHMVHEIHIMRLSQHHTGLKMKKKKKTQTDKTTKFEHIYYIVKCLQLISFYV